MLPEVRYDMGIVRKVMRGRRKLWIAREVSCKRWGTVSSYNGASETEKTRIGCSRASWGVVGMVTDRAYIEEHK